MNGYKIAALLKKDMKDTLKNVNCLIMILLPLFFVILYQSMDFGGEHMPNDFIMLMGLQMNMALIPVSVVAMMVAEEKEKNTLRTLMLSNVKAGEFLVSKLLVGYLMMQFVNLFIFFLTTNPISHLTLFLLATTLCGTVVLLIGASVGLISKNQMSTGIIGAPVALLLLIPSMFASLSPEGFIAKLASFLPNDAMIHILANGGSFRDYVVTIVWIVLTGLLFTLAYRKMQRDN